MNFFYLLLADAIKSALPEDSLHDMFRPGGQALQAGDNITNTKLAATLERIANEGIDVFYSGEIGQDVVNTVSRDTVLSYMFYLLC